MNESPQKADFEFSGYKIIDFHFSDPDPNYQVIHVDLNPIGVYDENSGFYKLDLSVFVTASKDAGKKDVVEVFRLLMQTGFNFPNKPLIDEIPNFFYSNSVAIAFPHIRAFVSTTTLQANVRLILLPLLNFTGLQEMIKQSTQVIKRDTLELSK